MAKGEPGYICHSCAARRGCEWPEGHRGSAHEGVCPHCSQTRMLTSITERAPEWPRVQSCLYSWCPNKREECAKCDAVLAAIRHGRAIERRLALGGDGETSDKKEG